MSEEREVVAGEWGSCECGKSAWLECVWQWQKKFCEWCGDQLLEGGHVTNLRRKAEAMLARFMRQGEIHGSWFCAEECRVLRKLLARGCAACAGSGYISRQNRDDTWYQMPCPDCQPDSKEAPNADPTD